jgi:hypothetical protein
MIPMRLARLAVAACLVGSLLACGRREECRAITDVVDKERATLSEDDHPTTPAELASRADHLDRIAKAVAAVPVKDAELKKAQDGYVGLLNDQASAVRAQREWLMSADSAKEKASKDAAEKIKDRSEVAEYAAMMKLCVQH